MTDMIETMREAGKKAGVAEARRILVAYLNGQNAEALAQLARQIPLAKKGLTLHLNDEDGGRPHREYWLSWIAEVEPAVKVSQGAVR